MHMKKVHKLISLWVEGQTNFMLKTKVYSTTGYWLVATAAINPKHAHSVHCTCSVIWGDMYDVWHVVRELVLLLWRFDLPQSKHVPHANEHQVSPHLSPAPEGNHLGAFNFLPVHGHLGHRDAQLLSNIQHLHIKGPGCSNWNVDSRLSPSHYKQETLLYIII